MSEDEAEHLWRLIRRSLPPLYHVEKVAENASVWRLLRFSPTTRYQIHIRQRVCEGRVNVVWKVRSVREWAVLRLSALKGA